MIALRDNKVWFVYTLTDGQPETLSTWTSQAKAIAAAEYHKVKLEYLKKPIFVGYSIVNQLNKEVVQFHATNDLVKVINV